MQRLGEPYYGCTPIPDGQTSFKVLFERLRSRPERVYGTGLGSSYQRQTLTLSKHFRRL